MSVDLYKVLNGYSIFGAASTLSGSAAPGGDSSFQDAATLGSLYLRTTGVLYIKTDSANSTTDWTALLTSGPSSLLLPPVNVADTTTYANVAAAQAAYNGSNTADGVSIVSGFRVLLTGLTSGTKSIYIVTGTTGSWTVALDTSFTLTAGNETYVLSGSKADDIYVYDGAVWQEQQDSGLLNELGYIRTFIGKATAGSVTPTYSATNFVTNGTSLEAAIGALDSGLFTAIGNRTYSNVNFVTSSQSLTASIQALDTGLQAFGQSTTTSNITTITTVDSVNCRAYNSAKWFINCVDHTTNSNKQTVEIFAVHDGTGSADATSVDYNVSSILAVNTAPNGLTFTVSLSGTGASQVMNLRITSTTSVDVKVARIRL